MDELSIHESLQYIRGVFPPRHMFDELVAEGSNGSESHTIHGDDLAGACWHLDLLMKMFGVDT